MSKNMTTRLIRRTLIVGLLAAVSASEAQVSAPTAEDQAKVPVPFRLETFKAKGPAALAARPTPSGYTPNPDPKDFTGAYVSVAAAGPGGDGGGPPGGGPPGGAAQGGPAPGAGPPPAGPNGPPGAGATGQTCAPSFGGGAYPTHLVSSPGRLTVVGEENHRLRRIYIDAEHPKNVQPTYQADSVAHWEGNTLVVDTIAIKGQNGVHLSERWTKQADGSIEVMTDYLDASGKTARTRNAKFAWRPDLTYIENICEDFAEAFGPNYGKGAK